MTPAVRRDGPIGVLAEGWDGVRGAELLRAALPHEDVLVVIDHALTPYARRRPDQVAARADGLSRQLIAEGAKAILCATAVASFGRQLGVDVPVRGLDCGLREALEAARGRPIAAISAAGDVAPMTVARAARRLRGGGSITLIERGDDAIGGLVARIHRHAPEAAVVALLTPSVLGDATAIGAAMPDVAVVDALAAAVRHLVHDLRRHHLIAHHGLRAGRITAMTTRGSQGLRVHEPLPSHAAASLGRRR